MNDTRVTVIKVGGSLLESPGLPQRLRTWLSAYVAAHPDRHLVLIAGGGKWVDSVRAINAETVLDTERTHWICVAIMDITAGLVAAMLPELRVVASSYELESRRREPGITVLQPGDFLANEEPRCGGTRLSCDWSVTSDAIAGRLAVVLSAEELVLIKSVGPPDLHGNVPWLDELATRGYVDAFLPKLAGELPRLRFETV
jgi:aspartokinase-like uncharacterized kinase